VSATSPGDSASPVSSSGAGDSHGRRTVLSEISIVIPTLGREILRQSLAAIADGTAWPAELIVVHQGEGEHVSTWLDELARRGLRTRYLPSAQRGRASAVNRGIEAARTRFVCVTDDDCFVDREWVAAMHRRLLLAPDSIVTGRVEAGTDEVLVVVTSPVESVQRRPHLQFDGLSGGNIGLALDLTRRIGLLDEDDCLRAAEDGEYAYRALRAGIPIVYAPEVAVTHMGWRSETERARQYVTYARSHGGFYGKYLRRGDLFIAARASVHHLRALKRWILGRVRGDHEAAANGRAYVLGLLPGILAGWRSSHGAEHHELGSAVSIQHDQGRP
jgi:GT2 family glycosyltransferase